KSDEEVNYKNSLIAHEAMTKKGAKHVRKLEVSQKFSHANCAGFATIHTKMYFDSFRKGSKYGRKGPLWKRFALRMAKWKTKETSLKRKQEQLAKKAF
ncbi:MAG: hypothetical protein ACKVTZ_05925, partial [Bacteroidia bacterium]